MKRRLINFALFQALWFWCVLWTARGESAIALGGGLVFLAALVAQSADRRRDFALVLALAAFGFALDSLQIAIGSYRAFGSAPGAMFGSALAPWWLVELWAGFAATLGSSLAWLTNRRSLACALGAICGPVAYLSGERLGALELSSERTRALVAIGAGWAFAMWIGFWLLARFSQSVARAR